MSFPKPLSQKSNKIFNNLLNLHLFKQLNTQKKEQMVYCYPFPPNLKLASKESFAYQLIDSIVLHSQVSACVNGCVASIGRLSAESKITPSYGYNKGVAIKAILEPEMCFNGPQGMLQCTDHNSIRYVYNMTVINKFISNPKNWDILMNIPTLQSNPISPLQWNVTDVHLLFPKEWKDKNLKVLTKVPFTQDFNFKQYEYNLLYSRKEAAKGSEGLIFISKEEYFQLYCLRELFIDSLLKWSKLESGKKSSDELHNLWDALLIGNYFPKRKEVNRLLNNLLKKECIFYIRQDIEQYYSDIILGGEFTLDHKAREWMNYLTNTIVNPPLMQQKDTLSYEELLMKKWDMYKKVFNIGFRFNDWVPLQPNEWKFYIDVLDNLKPLNYFEAKINKIFKELRIMNDHIVVIHVQLPKQNDNFYPGCGRVPPQFDNLISSQNVSHASWVDLFVNQLRLPKKTAVILIGYGFHFRDNSLFPMKELYEKHGILLRTQFDLLGSTRDDNRLTYSLLARTMALKSDFYIQGVCGTMFGYHILMERIVKGQLSCAADYIDLKEYIYGIGPHEFNHKTEMEFFFPRFHTSDLVPSFVVEKCGTYTNKYNLQNVAKKGNKF